MALRLREWRPRKRELNLFLQYSDIDYERQGIKPSCNSVPRPPASSSCSSEDVPHLDSRHHDDASRSRSRCLNDASRSRSRCLNDASRSRSRRRYDWSRSRSRRRDGASPSRSRSRRLDDVSRSRSRCLDDASRSRSRRRDGASPSRSRSRHRNDTSRSRSRRRNNASPSRSRSRCRDDASRSRSRHRNNASPSRSRSRCRDDASRSLCWCSYEASGLDIGRWTFPLPDDVFQKKLFSMIIELRNRLEHMQPTSSAVQIKKMETMEDFEREEEHLCDANAFNTLVLHISRIGGMNTKDRVHKVLDRLFTNLLMAQFNMKGKGTQGKKSLEKTKIYSAIKDGIMTGDSTATEYFIRINAAEHLKHAPQRRGGHRLALDSPGGEKKKSVL